MLTQLTHQLQLFVSPLSPSQPPSPNLAAPTPSSHQCGTTPPHLFLNRRDEETWGSKGDFFGSVANKGQPTQIYQRWRKHKGPKPWNPQRVNTQHIWEQSSSTQAPLAKAPSKSMFSFSLYVCVCVSFHFDPSQLRWMYIRLRRIYTSGPTSFTTCTWIRLQEHTMHSDWFIHSFSLRINTFNQLRYGELECAWGGGEGQLSWGRREEWGRGRRKWKREGFANVEKINDV